MSTDKPSAQEAVLSALGSQPNAAVSEIAAATGLGRSTVGKTFVVLEQAGRVQRMAGGREGARRIPDRWSLAPEGENEAAPPRSERLRPGQLDGLVLDYLRDHAEDVPLAPTAVAKGLERSSGAVGNCLVRLAEAGQVRQVSERPRRYQLA
jgi:DNA-binding IclR family transcriptional regulator